MSKTNPKTRPAWTATVSIAIPCNPADPQQAVAAKAAIETVLKSLPPGAVAEITRASFGRMEVQPITPASNDAKGLEAKAPAEAITTGIAEETNSGASYETATAKPDFKPDGYDDATAHAREPGGLYAPSPMRDQDEIPEHTRRLPRARGG